MIKLLMVLSVASFAMVMGLEVSAMVGYVP